MLHPEFSEFTKQIPDATQTYIILYMDGSNTNTLKLVEQTLYIKIVLHFCFSNKSKNVINK